MANSKRDILAKIADILVEVNEDYSNLQHNDGRQEVTSLYLLTAKTKQLTAFLEVLEKIEQTNSFERSITHSPSVDRLEADQSSIGGAVAQEQQGEADDSATEGVENVAHEYQHGTPEPTLPEVEDVEDFVPEVDQEEQESEVEDDHRFITSETVDHWEEEAEEQGAADDDVEQEVEQAAEEDVAEGEGEAVHEESAEQESEIEYDEVEEEEQPEPFIESEEDELPNEESTTEEPVREQEDSRVQPTITQVVEEQREVAIEDSRPPVQEEKPSRPLTLNEIIQQQKKEGLTNVNQFNTSAQSERVLDLKTAVSLNDKLLFIKDLFNGYSLAYSEAIELLNRFDNFAEADVFLQTNYAIKNNWASKPQTVEKLYAILRKKFI